MNDKKKPSEPVEEERWAERRSSVKIEIIGDAKEIAALVLAVQERQSQINLVSKRVVEDLGESDRAMTARCSSENFR